MDKWEQYQRHFLLRYINRAVLNSAVTNQVKPSPKMLLVLIVCYFSIVSALNTTQKRHVSSYNPPTLPEVIINRSNGGYNYPVPNPPIAFDDPLPKPPSDNYGPPLQDDPPTYLPPQFDPIPTLVPETPGQYLPPHPPSTSYGDPVNQNDNVQQFRIFNMSCLDMNTRKFFRVNFRTQSGYEPLIENSRKNCLTGSGNNYYLDVNEINMIQCGVRYCSTNDRTLCAQIRIPTIRGIRLPEDRLITIQCRPQETVATKTNYFRITPKYNP